MSLWVNLGVALHDIVSAPFQMNLWWQLLPILMLWAALEVYLDWHKHEELGWNSALGNGISLFWIVIAAMQPLFTRTAHEPFRVGVFFLLLCFLTYAVFIIYVSFLHKLSSQLIYQLAYPTIIYYLAVFSILWGYKALNLNRYVLIVFVLLFGVVVAVRWLIFWILPDAPDDEVGERSVEHASAAQPGPSQGSRAVPPRQGEREGW